MIRGFPRPEIFLCYRLVGRGSCDDELRKTTVGIITAISSSVGAIEKFAPINYGIVRQF